MTFDGLGWETGTWLKNSSGSAIVTVRTPVGAWVRNVGEKGGDGRTVEPMIKQLDQP